MKATIRTASALDVMNIIPLIRQSDINEIYASDGVDVKEAILDGCTSSINTYVAVRGETLIAIFGVSPYPSDPLVGIPWMLATDEMEKHSKDLLRISPEYIEKMHDHFPILTNMVDVRNEKSIRWLTWCGFTFPKRIEKYGYEQRPFLQFIRYA